MFQKCDKNDSKSLKCKETNSWNVFFSLNITSQGTFYIVPCDELPTFVDPTFDL